MSGGFCPPEYHGLLRVLAEKLTPKEISGLFARAQSYLLTIASELADNLCCTPDILSQSQRISLRRYRPAIRALVQKRTGQKAKRTVLKKNPTLVKLLAQIALSYG